MPFETSDPAVAVEALIDFFDEDPVGSNVVVPQQRQAWAGSAWCSPWQHTDDAASPAG